MALCKVMIIGNLGSDPEMRYTPNNRAVTQFNVAVNQSTKNQQTGEWVEETDWFRVSVWGDRAERMAETLRKGNKVFVEGRFKTRQFEGRDGQMRTSLEITADSIVNLDRPVVGAYLVIIVFFFVALNLVVDLLYSVLDPRVRLEARAR